MKAPWTKPDEGEKPIDRLDLYKVYRSYIEHEDDLINQRTTWFIQLHSFLIASYGITFAAFVNSFNFDDVDPLMLLFVRVGVILFLSAVTFVGLSSAKAAMNSIQAATFAINSLRNDGNALLQAPKMEGRLLPGLTWGGIDLKPEDDE